MPKSLLVVFTDAVEGMEDQFNHWMNSEHVPDVVAVPGVLSGTRYELTDVELVPGIRIPHMYLHLFEVEGETDEEFEKVAYEMRRPFIGDAVVEATRLTDADVNTGKKMEESFDYAKARASFARPIFQVRHGEH